MAIWEDPIHFTLPDHEDAQNCYDDLARQPILSEIFNQVILPLGRDGGDLPERIRKIEAARTIALDRVSGTDEMVMYQYMPFDCCILDFYNGFIFALGKHIQQSDRSSEEKVEAILQIQAAIEEAVPWNPFKQMELGAVISTFMDD